MLYLCGHSENTSQEEILKSSDKFDDLLLDEPTPSKSSKSTPDTSLQDLVKTMSSQLGSLTSQFEEFKHKDKPSSSQRDPPFPQEQGICAPASQTRTDNQKVKFLMIIPICLPENAVGLGVLRMR